MEKHIVNSYEEELHNLRNSVVNMANLVKDILVYGIRAIETPSKSYVEIADSTDKKINHFDKEVEKLAIQVIALRQPMAIDLRHVIAALKLAVILERMGDLSKKISHRVEYLPIKLDNNLTTMIVKMSNKLLALLEKVIKAYADLNDKTAREVSKQDVLIDNFYKDIMSLLEKEMQSKPNEIQYLINIVLIVRNLERLGDYITKISYITHYIITGDKIIND